MAFRISPALRARGLVAALALGAAPGAGAAPFANLAVTSTVTEIVGATAVVSGSGSPSNTAVWSDGDAARFVLTGDDGSRARRPVSYGLEITPISMTGGGIGPGNDSLMIARTVDSQGLTDDGTISIYINPTAGGRWRALFSFTWFDPTFLTLVAPSLRITSLDLDYDQTMTLLTAEASSFLLNDPTDVVRTDADGRATFTGEGQAEFNNPRAAVIANYEGRSAFDVELSHDSVALYMFEFRNPPTNFDTSDFPLDAAPIPGPPAAALLLAALAAPGGGAAAGARPDLRARGRAGPVAGPGATGAGGRAGLPPPRPPHPPGAAP